MKANEQFFPMVMFIMLYKVVLSFESAHGWKGNLLPSGKRGNIRKCDEMFENKDNFVSYLGLDRINTGRLLLKITIYFNSITAASLIWIDRVFTWRFKTEVYLTDTKPLFMISFRSVSMIADDH